MSLARDILDRRTHERFPAHLALQLLPTDANRLSMGEPFAAVSIDLSQSGLCCVSDRMLLADFAIVQVLQIAASEAELRLFAQRIRCSRKGQMFEIALRFKEKLPVE